MNLPDFRLALIILHVVILLGARTSPHAERAGEWPFGATGSSSGTAEG